MPQHAGTHASEKRNFRTSLAHAMLVQPGFRPDTALIGFFRVFKEFLFVLLTIVAQVATMERLESFSRGSLNYLLGL